MTDQGPDRGNATLDNISGNVKSFVGSVINNEELHREGEQEKAKGEATYKAAQMDDKKESVKDNVKGVAQEHIGGLFSDKQKAKGKANQASADMLDEKSKH